MKRLLFLFLLLPLFACSAYAEEPGRIAMETYNVQALENGLSDEEAAISGKLRYGSYDTASALFRLWNAFLERLRTELRAGFGIAASILALVFLCAFSSCVCSVDRIRELLEICGVCAAGAMLFGNVNSLVSQTVNALYRLSDYSKAALPVLYSAAAAGGAVSSSAMHYAAASLALDVMMSLSQKAVIPLIYANLALVVSNALFSNPLLTSMVQLTKWCAKTVLTAATLAFTTYLGLGTLVSTGIDAAAVKAARTVISTSLPVVGGMLSDASAAVLSAAGVIRSCSGAFGVIAVSAMCVGPLALLSVKNFLFKAVAAAAESVQNARLQRLFNGIGNAVGLLMGLLGSSAVMLFLSFAAGMRVVAA